MLGALTLMIVLARFVFPTYQIASNSMSPTINRGDYIVINRFSYLFSEPQKNDIVLFEPLDDIFQFGPWTHRIIGTTNDRISVVNGLVSVNKETALFPTTAGPDLEAVVPVESVFQKGDSFNSIMGNVEKNKIIGKVIYWFNF